METEIATGIRKLKVGEKHREDTGTDEPRHGIPHTPPGQRQRGTVVSRAEESRAHLSISLHGGSGWQKLFLPSFLALRKLREYNQSSTGNLERLE